MFLATTFLKWISKCGVTVAWVKTFSHILNLSLSIGQVCLSYTYRGIFATMTGFLRLLVSHIPIDVKDM